jgi:hypothetical protein
MIDFQSGGFFARLGPSYPKEIAAKLAPLLVDGEAVHLTFKGMRDSVVFTNRRLITVNVQGMTGKKRDYSSLPCSKIQAWSGETAGMLPVTPDDDHAKAFRHRGLRRS